MDRAAGSGLEVEIATSPQIVLQPDTKKYHITGGASSHHISSHSDVFDQSHRKSQSRFKTVWILAIIAILCLAVAIGIGLGVGLANQHKSSSSSDAPTPTTGTNDTSATVIQAGNAPVTVTQSGSTLTISPTPATLPSASCPAANGSTYTATNKPLPTIASQVGYQIAEPSLLFEILCNTNLAEDGHIIDIQLIPNTSTLNDCLDECALFSFRTRLENFPTHACTAVAWGTMENLQRAGDAWPLCWLKSNATLGSSNMTNTKGSVDGGVLLVPGS